MRRIFESSALVALVYLVLTGSVRAELIYTEEVTAETTHRVTQVIGGEKIVVYDETFSGHQDFGLPASHLAFAHVFLPLNESFPENMKVQALSLSLILRNGAGEDIEVTIDSVDMREFARRTFVTGPGGSDFVTVVQSPLADGEVYVVLNSPEALFSVYKSRLSVRFAGGFPTGVLQEIPTIQSRVELHPNHPDPPNPSTVIEFTLPMRTLVRVDIVTSIGQVVRTLFDGIEAAGEHRLEWDGRADDGAVLSTGMYFYRVSTEAFTESRKMMLVK